MTEQRQQSASCAPSGNGAREGFRAGDSVEVLDKTTGRWLLAVFVRTWTQVEFCTRCNGSGEVTDGNPSVDVIVSQCPSCHGERGVPVRLFECEGQDEQGPFDGRFDAEHIRVDEKAKSETGFRFDAANKEDIDLSTLTGIRK